MSKKKIEILIHVAIWAVMFIWPLMFMNHGKGVNLLQCFFMSVVQVGIMIAFYANYLWLTPKYFEGGNKKMFWIINCVLIVLLAFGVHCWMTMTHSIFGEEKGTHHEPMMMVTYLFILRDMFNLAIAAAIATALRLALRWQDSETARRQAETARTKAELKNLRSQINPHFLLNTLNNIYALTAFNTEKAQNAIQELSKLLRYVLYDNEEPYVELTKEVQFINNYINLMKIRVSGKVDIQFKVDMPAGCTVKIAPLIFISLIENAFKHGISPTAASFIHIGIKATPDQIVCDIQNSNHPKSSTDKSGHGIGLKQVASRLELMYPRQYEWQRGTNEDNTVYSSRIIIRTQPQKANSLIAKSK